MEIHQSARKHGIRDDEVRHAIEHAVIAYDVGDESSPARTLYIGGTSAGNLVEVVVVTFDDGRELAIHAMAKRAIYRDLLP